MKTLNEFNKKDFGEKIGEYLRESWYFEKWYEKLILVGLCLLGLIKIIQFLFGYLI